MQLARDWKGSIVLSIVGMSLPPLAAASAQAISGEALPQGESTGDQTGKSGDNLDKPMSMDLGRRNHAYVDLVHGLDATRYRPVETADVRVNPILTTDHAHYGFRSEFANGSPWPGDSRRSFQHFASSDGAARSRPAPSGITKKHDRARC